jgi:hypothetical protein
MSEEIKQRLMALQSEYESGQKMLAELDARRSTLVNTLLRIEGAIQVLKELSSPTSGGGVAQVPDATALAARPD